MTTNSGGNDPRPADPRAPGLVALPDRVDEHGEIFVGRPAGRADEQRGPPRSPRGGRAAVADRQPDDVRETPEQVLARRRRRSSEDGRGPVVEHDGARDAPVLRQGGLHVPGDAQVRVGAPADDALVPVREPDERMALPEPQGQHRVPEIVPVHHQPGRPQARRRERDQQRWDGRRVLDENNVRLAHDAQEEPQEAQTLSQHLDRGPSHEATARGPVAGALRPRREEMPADVLMVANGGMERAARVPDHVHLGQSGGERQGMVLHARAAPDVAQHHDTHPDPLLTGHPVTLPDRRRCDAHSHGLSRHRASEASPQTERAGSIIPSMARVGIDPGGGDHWADRPDQGLVCVNELRRLIGPRP